MTACDLVFYAHKNQINKSNNIMYQNLFMSHRKICFTLQGTARCEALDLSNCSEVRKNYAFFKLGKICIEKKRSLFRKFCVFVCFCFAFWKDLLKAVNSCEVHWNVLYIQMTLFLVFLGLL